MSPCAIPNYVFISKAAWILRKWDYLCRKQGDPPASVVIKLHTWDVLNFLRVIRIRESIRTIPRVICHFEGQFRCWSNLPLRITRTRTFIFSIFYVSPRERKWKFNFSNELASWRRKRVIRRPLSRTSISNERLLQGSSGYYNERLIRNCLTASLLRGWICRWHNIPKFAKETVERLSRKLSTKFKLSLSVYVVLHFYPSITDTTFRWYRYIIYKALW